VIYNYLEINVLISFKNFIDPTLLNDSVNEIASIWQDTDVYHKKSEIPISWNISHQILSTFIL